MLKAELERRLKEADLKVAEFRINNTKLTAQLHSYTKEAEELNVRLKFISNQMKLIDHSLHTMLQVKFPNNNESMSHAIHSCMSATEVTDTIAADSEEKRFLLFLRDLCTTGVHSASNSFIHSASDLFNHLGR